MHGRSAALISAILLAAACGAATLKPKGPAQVFLALDLPRREVAGVSERWVLVRPDNRAFLLHTMDVERRRTLQSCGAVPNDAFVKGWAKLDAADLLLPVEDLRLVPPRGTGPFAGRLQLEFEEDGRRITARRPLSAADLRKLVRVLRTWKAVLRPASPTALPPELRVEVAIGGCTPQDEPPSPMR
jgi:hypothetical protein